MSFRTMAWAACVVAASVAVAATVGGVARAADGSQYIPGLMYRSGPYAPSGIPFANGIADYFTLLNERDGGIGGVRIEYVECDTQYNNDRGVECYERLKRPDAAAVFPLSTGITYALIDRATADKIPMHTMGYGRTAAGDGRVFPYIFTMPISYWAGADSIVTYIAGQEGGFDKLKGKKIALIYHDSAYGKEPIATLEKLAAQHGFEFSKFPVPHPGLEQKATWLQIRQLRPAYVLMWGWGVMNSTAIKEAAAVGFPMDHFIGIWWSASEEDVRPAGSAAKNYKALTFHGTGDRYPLFQDIYKHVYDRGKGAGERSKVGEVLYNRGLLNAVIIAEAIRAAQAKHGAKPLLGEQVRDGFESLNITEARLKELGLPDFTNPIAVTCADHEGGGRARIQQWDGAKWSPLSDRIEPHRETLLRPMIEEAAAQYAAEKGIAPRTCPAE